MRHAQTILCIRAALTHGSTGDRNDSIDGTGPRKIISSPKVEDLLNSLNEKALTVERIKGFNSYLGKLNY